MRIDLLLYKSIDNLAPIGNPHKAPTTKAMILSADDEEFFRTMREGFFSFIDPKICIRSALKIIKGKRVGTSTRAQKESVCSIACLTLAAYKIPKQKHINNSLKKNYKTAQDNYKTGAVKTNR